MIQEFGLSYAEASRITPDVFYTVFFPGSPVSGSEHPAKVERFVSANRGVTLQRADGTWYKPLDSELVDMAYARHSIERD